MTLYVLAARVLAHVGHIGLPRIHQTVRWWTPRPALTIIDPKGHRT